MAPNALGPACPFRTRPARESLTAVVAVVILAPLFEVLQMPLDKTKLGTRYVCFACGTKFYDLNRPVPTCPECSADQCDAPVQDMKAIIARNKRAAAAAPPEPAEPVETKEKEPSDDDSDGLFDSKDEEDGEEEEEAEEEDE